MAIGDIIVSLDIGASKTAAVVGQVNKFDEIEIMGYGLAPSSGIKKGKIVNVEPVAESIVKAITEAEETSGLYINSAYVNIKGMNTRIEQIRFKGEVERPDDGLSKKDISNVMTNIRLALNTSEKEQIIDILPTKYTVNDRDYKEEPIGAFAKYYIMDADCIYADKSTVQMVTEVMRLAELDVDGFVLETLASSNVVLMPEEKNMGVLMLDVGASHTDISVYKNGELEFNTTLPIGGDHITNDISIALNVDIEEAEKLKRQYNLAIEAMITNNHDVKLLTKRSNDDNKNIVRCGDIIKIIEARIKELYQIIRRMMAENNLIGKVECVVITGQGLSNITGVEELAVLTLKINQVRMCLPKLVNVIKPQHVVAYGMVKYVAKSSCFEKISSDVEIAASPSIKDKIHQLSCEAKEKANKLKHKLTNMKKKDKGEK